MLSFPLFIQFHEFQEHFHSPEANTTNHKYFQSQMTKTLTDHMQSTKGTCSCDDSYIGDTMRNVQMRFHERTNSLGDSEPAHVYV